jgi:hypothetical protein
MEGGELMTWKWVPGTWWSAPENDRRWAYYLCLRRCHGMAAREALRYVKDHFEAVNAAVGGSADTLAVCREGTMNLPRAARALP